MDPKVLGWTCAERLSCTMSRRQELVCRDVRAPLSPREGQVFAFTCSWIGVQSRFLVTMAGSRCRSPRFPQTAIVRSGYSIGALRQGCMRSWSTSFVQPGVRPEDFVPSYYT